MIFMNETNLSLKYLIDQLHKEQTLTKEEWITLIEGRTPELSEYLFSMAREERHRYYGHDVYVRGLIEFTNYCKNDCLYCGIRKSNGNAHRYRLSEADILKCCKEGYELGFRTFVLQGGEDGYYTDERIIHLIRIIKERYPDCAITLSIGENPKIAIRLTMMPAPTAIFCGMKLITTNITESFIHRTLVLNTGSNVCGI